MVGTIRATRTIGEEGERENTGDNTVSGACRETGDGGADARVEGVATVQSCNSVFWAGSFFVLEASSDVFLLSVFSLGHMYV
jgi:hypothetical protein